MSQVTALPVRQATVVLSNADILVWPTVPIRILTGVPGRVTIPRFGTFYVDTLAGGYGNIATRATVTVQLAPSNLQNLSRVGAFPVVPGSLPNQMDFIIGNPQQMIVQLTALGGVEASVFANIGTGGIGNPWFVVCFNQALGNFTGGHPLNRVIVSIEYSLFNPATGLFE